MKFRSKLFIVVSAAALAVGAAFGYSVFGMQNGNLRPGVVATVRLSAVLDALQQRADAAANLKQMNDQIVAENAARNEAMEKMLEEVKALPDGSAERQAKQETFALERLKHEAWLNFSQKKTDIEASLVMQDLYRSVKAAIAQMAAASRIDVVLIDDSKGELITSAESRVSRVEQVRQQIASRRLLYVNPTIDITDDLIERMNNAWKAGAAGEQGG